MSQKMLDAIGLSAAYRAIWARDFPLPNTGTAMMSTQLGKRLDDESRALLDLSRKLSKYVSETCLTPFLDIDSQAMSALFPKQTMEALRSFGYQVDGADRALFHRGGTVPIASAPQDESLSHYGLRYLSKAALGCLENRDIVDAGSYDGTSATFFLESYPINRVFCFEPDPHNFALLSDRTKGEVEGQRIIVTQKALSNRLGLSTMSPAGVGSSRSKADLGTEPRIVVKSTTLDAFFRDHADANIGLIKLDVEGDAVQALQGSVQTIRKHRPVLIVSFYHTPEEFAETPPYMVETFPDYDFMVRKVAPNLFKEHVMIGVPKLN